MLRNQGSASTGMGVRFAPEYYDFATIGQEDEVEHVFEFANAGDQELVIDRLHAS